MDQSTSETPPPGKLNKVSSYLFRKLQGFYELSDAVRDSISEAFIAEVSYEPGATIQPSGEAYRAIYLIERGWVLRSRYLESGGRQIVNVALPGDFLCFNATLFTDSDFDHVAKTQVLAFKLDAPTFATLMAHHAHLALALAWANAHEEGLLSERIVSLGRRNARERTAHVLCELAVRLNILGLINGNSLQIPLTQADFADILGMSLIHVSRTFRALTQLGLITYRSGLVTIHDVPRLEKLAGFDAGYMHFTQRKDIFRV
jgi:CRP-like cAMP-binding protein